jgi:hypothetical protein
MNVCFWHKADMWFKPVNVRFRGNADIAQISENVRF